MSDQTKSTSTNPPDPWEPTWEKSPAIREALLLHLPPDVAEPVRAIGRALFELVDSLGLYRPPGSWTAAQLGATVAELRFVRQYLETLSETRFACGLPRRTRGSPSGPKAGPWRPTSWPRRSRRRCRRRRRPRSRRPGLRAGRYGRLAPSSARPARSPFPARPPDPDSPRPRAPNSGPIAGPSRASRVSILEPRPGGGESPARGSRRQDRPPQAASGASVPPVAPLLPGTASRPARRAPAGPSSDLPPSRGVLGVAVREWRHSPTWPSAAPAARPRGLT